MTQEEVDALRKRVEDRRKPIVVEEVIISHARGRAQPRDRGMNKTEQEYARHLEGEKVAGRILFYDFECIKIRMADTCYWIPDFLVMDADGFMELHDTKAFWKKTGKPGIEGDALVKMKGIGEKYPMFKVLATWKESGVWKQRVF